MDVHIKRRGSGDHGSLLCEAAGLRWLAAADAAPVVRVLAVDDDALELERLRSVRPTPEAAETFGRHLSEVHAAGAPAFGSPPDGWTGDIWIGVQSQPARPTPTWGPFFAEQRIAVFLPRAVDNGNLTVAESDLVLRVCERIAAGEFDAMGLPGPPEPARIHGDLWTGNLIFTDRGGVLIDPAAHGGHRLTDPAMLALFGAPHLETILNAYAESAGLVDGWHEALVLHQMHPLATHSVRHGRGYGTALVSAARRVAAW